MERLLVQMALADRRVLSKCLKERMASKLRVEVRGEMSRVKASSSCFEVS